MPKTKTTGEIRAGEEALPGPKKAARAPRRKVTSDRAKTRAFAGQPDASPFDGVAFLRELR